MTLDIHDYDRMYASAERLVAKSALSQRNKDLIFGYRDACLIKNVCGRVRLIRAMGALLLLGRMLEKDFDQVTRRDAEALVARLLARRPAYSAETIGTYKAMFKRFMTWVANPDGFPDNNPSEAVAWIKCHVRRRDKHKLDRSSLLTPEDVDRLLAVCHHPRDTALVSVLWESGCRISEVGNLAVGKVTKDSYGYLLDVTGKTGARTPLIVGSAPHLTVWFNHHPWRTDQAAPLWAEVNYGVCRQMKYPAIRALLRRLLARAGLTKRVHPHLFRHSRATYLVASGLMNEQQVKAYLGWSPDSDMLATYAHLLTSDSNAAILRENRLAAPEQRAPDLVARPCPVCRELNPTNGEFCTRCGAPLQPGSLYTQRTAAQQQAILADLLQLAMRSGVTDEVLNVVHKAGLGPTLRELTGKQHTDM
jgi:integrase